MHHDHFDLKLLGQMQDKSVQVLLADFKSGSLVEDVKALGFTNVTTLSHLESKTLKGGLQATVVLDVSFKEDSGLLLCTPERGGQNGHRFLHLNDCNTRHAELPKQVDLLACQFSGAQWYPSCYDGRA